MGIDWTEALKEVEEEMFLTARAAKELEFRLWREGKWAIAAKWSDLVTFEKKGDMWIAFLNGEPLGSLKGEAEYEMRGFNVKVKLGAVIVAYVHGDEIYALWREARKEGTAAKGGRFEVLEDGGVMMVMPIGNAELYVPIRPSEFERIRDAAKEGRATALIVALYLGPSPSAMLDSLLRSLVLLLNNTHPLCMVIDPDSLASA